MLVLRRKLGESFMIGDDIEISVVSIRGGTIHLGITAKETIKILRRELYETVDGKQKENTGQADRQAKSDKAV